MNEQRVLEEIRVTNNSVAEAEGYRVCFAVARPPALVSAPRPRRRRPSHCEAVPHAAVRLGGRGVGGHGDVRLHANPLPGLRDRIDRACVGSTAQFSVDEASLVPGTPRGSRRRSRGHGRPSARRS
jgi:hypothetical protein